MPDPVVEKAIASRLAAGAAALVLLVVLGLVLTLIYLTVPGDDHVTALLSMGVISLVFGLVAYFAQALGQSVHALRMLTMGFGGLGFGLLILTILFAPSSPDETIDPIARIVGLVVVFLVLAGVLAGAAWSARGRAHDAVREARRAEWTSKPAPNALDYPTARSPNAPPPSAPAQGDRPA
ncbi:MAG TPA: hypothetical protein VGV64_03860 [Thermoplasmata archaeon]|nr:hypothetical protein [Thermoplasmata archaeon]